MPRASLLQAVGVGLLFSLGLSFNSGCIFSQRRRCGREILTPIPPGHPSARFHEAQRVQHQALVFQVSKAPVAPQAPPPEISISGGKFPASLTVNLLPGADIKLREASRCPHVAQVDSSMPALLTASTGQPTRVQGQLTTADPRSSLDTMYVVSVDPATIDIEYQLLEPKLSEVTGFTLRLFYSRRGTPGGTITADVTRFTGTDRRSVQYGSQVTLLLLDAPGETRSSKGTFSSSGTSTQWRTHSK